MKCFRASAQLGELMKQMAEHAVPFLFIIYYQYECVNYSKVAPFKTCVTY